MTGHNYPDHFYADALARDEKPLGAYQAQPELSPAERKLRTAKHYIYHANLLIDEALKLIEQEGKPASPAAMREAKIAYDVACDQPKGSVVIHEAGVPPPGGWKQFEEPERIPKWDPAWGKAPNCDGLKARDIRAPHPMQAEAIREHDERLQGPEDAL